MSTDTHTFAVVDPMRYLTNSKGEQVTPLIRMYGTPDPLPLDVSRGQIRMYHLAHENVTKAEKEQAIEASLRFHQKFGTMEEKAKASEALQNLRRERGSESPYHIPIPVGEERESSVSKGKWDVQVIV